MLINVYDNGILIGKRNVGCSYGSTTGVTLLENKQLLENYMSKNKETLKQCYQNCESFDEFCERCNKQVNEVPNMTAQEVYEELQSKHDGI